MFFKGRREKFPSMFGFSIFVNVLVSSNLELPAEIPTVISLPAPKNLTDGNCNS